VRATSKRQVFDNAQRRLRSRPANGSLAHPCNGFVGHIARWQMKALKLTTSLRVISAVPLRQWSASQL